MLAALGIQHAMCMRRIAVCGLPGSTHYHIKGTIFERIKKSC